MSWSCETCGLGPEQDHAPCWQTQELHEIGEQLRRIAEPIEHVLRFTPKGEPEDWTITRADGSTERVVGHRQGDTVTFDPDLTMHNGDRLERTPPARPYLFHERGPIYRGPSPPLAAGWDEQHDSVSHTYRLSVEVSPPSVDTSIDDVAADAASQVAIERRLRAMLEEGTPGERTDDTERPPLSPSRHRRRHQP